MFTEGQEILEKRYQVIKKLGSGAFGEIYKGRRTLHSHKLADTEVFSGKEKDRRTPGR